MNLITGATGLLGSYLAKLLLAKGEKVRAIKRSTSDTSLLGKFVNDIEWIEADILDISSLEEAMHGVKKVYHCAAVITFIPSEIDQMMKVNMDGTANVMNAALSARIEKMVHVSSEAAFGIAPEGKVIDENYFDPGINKHTWYYRSKHYGEREAWRAHAEGLNVVVVCPATLLGGGWWNHQPNSLFREIYNGLGFYTSATNGFIDVRDAANCMYQLMKGDFNGEKFLLVAENISLRDVIWMMSDALDVKRPSVEVGKMLMGIAWRWEVVKSWFTNRNPIITKESAALAEINFLYSNEKIKRALNYNFRPIRDTISEIAEVFLKSEKEKKGYGVFE